MNEIKKTRVAELTIEQANAETRPYRIIGAVSTEKTIIVEYLDLDDPDQYEYRITYDGDAATLLRNEGWAVYATRNDSFGRRYDLRRLRTNRPKIGVYCDEAFTDFLENLPSKRNK